MRQFYLTYSQDIESQNLELESNTDKNKTSSIWQKASAKLENFTLSWSHYLVLMRIKDPAERRFYEIEAKNQQWSEPQLSRQYHSSLYQRLALSRNKEEMLASIRGQTIEKPSDILKIRSH